MDKASEENSTMWVPICCERVMRHHVFPGKGGTATAATLGCAHCGKHIMLGPEPIASIQEYGKGSQVIPLLATQSAMAPKSAAAVPVAGDLDETMA